MSLSAADDPGLACDPAPSVVRDAPGLTGR
jgi:hypothetical protein